jgi:hypothetical protein
MDLQFGKQILTFMCYFWPPSIKYGSFFSDNADLFFSFKERIQLETSRLYRQAGVNPLAGILLMNL